MSTHQSSPRPWSQTGPSPSWHWAGTATSASSVRIMARRLPRSPARLSLVSTLLGLAQRLFGKATNHGSFGRNKGGCGRMRWVGEVFDGLGVTGQEREPAFPDGAAFWVEIPSVEDRACG